MAETLLYSIAGKILGELGSQALREVKSLWGFGAKDELDKLQDTVSTIQAVLLDAQNKQSTNHEVRDWLRKLEAELYDADDLLDDFSTEVLRRKLMTPNRLAPKQVRIFFSPKNQIVFGFKMALQVKAIRRRLNAISDDKNRFHFTPQLADVPFVNRKREETHSFVREEDVIGREKDKNAIMELLFNSEVQEDVSIIPIVGIGGLGKTALAQLAYNDDRVKDHFELKMWVCVSDVFDVKLIAQGIIESATGKKSKRIQMDGIQGELKRIIDGKKYFLVLDDVWNDDRNLWLELRPLLMGGASGSKILLTTRMEVVATIMGAASPYLLQCLSEEESWSLFKQMAFQPGVEPNKTMVAIGKEIVKKCVGVPLAIRTVGSMLYIKNTEKEWHSFKNKELSKITQTERDIIPLLKLSYNHMPSHLKKCFVYCSIFPKDHWLRRKTLIQLWIAQGFIELSNERQRLEEIGDEYFMELSRRSFLQDVRKDILGNVKVCKMHDLIHDLAQSIAGNEICAIGLDANDDVARTRHAFASISIDSSWEIPSPLFEAKKLRTLLFPIQVRVSLGKDDPEQMSESTSNKIISSFKRLRVLDLHDLAIKRVPNFICKSNHLRYLDLSNNPLELLPKYICKLQNLQTLKLNWCMYLKELPRETSNLVSLRHLEIGGCSSLSHMPRGLGQLTSIETLTDFKVFNRDDQGISPNDSVADISELTTLVKLRNGLRIVGLRGSMIERSKECPNDSYCYVSGMKFLEELDLMWDSQDTDGARDDNKLLLLERLCPHSHLKQLSINDYGGVSFPSWMMVNMGLLLPNLVKITLWGCRRCQHPPRFGLLPSLQALALSLMDCLEYVYEEEEEEDCESSGVCHSTSPPSKAPILFPSLKTLHLSDLRRLKGIIGSKRSRREVILRETTSSSLATEELSLTSSFGATRHLPALEYLHINCCPELDLLADGDETFKQIQSLRRLQIMEQEKLVSLPMGLRYLTNLESLELSQWRNLVVLPEFIGDLTSLQHLNIECCKSLTSLPDCLRYLTTLKRLYIVDCPLLVDRCEKETGEDWPKIAHIPNIIIYSL